MVEFLDGLETESESGSKAKGFDCYWEANTGQLLKITGCWHPIYEAFAFRWSNVACARRGGTWHAVVEKIRRQQVQAYLKEVVVEESGKSVGLWRSSVLDGASIVAVALLLIAAMSR